VIVSESERAAGALTQESLASALRRLREAGYVVFESLIPGDLTRELRDAFQAIHEEELRDREADPEWNRRGGRGPRFELPFMDPLMIENPIGMQVMEAVMGSDLWGMLPYHTNTSFPGAHEQEVHRDTQHLFPELTHALPPAMLILHVPLVDFTDQNGSTELWPGTHLITDLDPHTGERLDMAERAKDMPSVRTNMPAGSLVVRDMRVWHRHSQPLGRDTHDDLHGVLQAVPPVPAASERVAAEGSVGCARQALGEGASGVQVQPGGLDHLPPLRAARILRSRHPR